MSKPLAALMAALILVLCACGCEPLLIGRKAVRASVNSFSHAKEEIVGDPVALSTVKAVAVLPFDNKAPEPGFDADAFSTKFANKLISTGKVKVIYPQQVQELLDAENAKIKRHNVAYHRRKMLGIKPSAERAAEQLKATERLGESVSGEEDVRRAYLDPVRNIDDAVKIGRLLKADAILMGVVTDYDPYMRPRMALLVKAIATGQSDAAAIAMAELTQWGIPRAASTARGEVWYIQQNFDSRDGNIGRNVYLYAMNHHTEEHPYNTDVYLRSMDLYYDYVSTILSRAFLSARHEAVKVAEQKALDLALKNKATQLSVKTRIRQLVDPHWNLPDPDKVMQNNMKDRRDYSWRPDIYSKQHPEKEEKLRKPEMKKKSLWGGF